MNNYLCVCLINAVWAWYQKHSPFCPITLSESATYYWKQINIEIDYAITFLMQEITKGAGEMYEKGLGYCL